MTSQSSQGCFSSSLFLCSSLFLLTLLLRLINYFLNPDLTFAFLSVFGVPFADAHNWNELAVDIAQGKGMRGDWSAQRPLFPILLASFYTWFGPSFSTGKLVNIFCSGLLVPFVFLIAKKLLGPLVALFVALTVILNTEYMNLSLTIMSEPAGALFFAVSLFLFLQGLDRRKGLDFFGSGVALGLSNLARPLTLIVFPGYLLCLFSLRDRVQTSARSAFLHGFLALLGLLVVLAPWLIRQTVTHGIFTISDKTAESFYAATTQNFRGWNEDLDKEMTERGITGIKGRYDYQTQLAFQNLRDNPRYFVVNLITSSFFYLGILNMDEGAFQNITTLLLIVLFAFTYPGTRGRKQKILLVLLIGCMIFFRWFPPSWASIAVTLCGMALAFIYSPRSLVLSLSLLLSTVGMAMADPSISYRLFAVVGWLYQLFHLYFFYTLVWKFYDKVIIDKFSPQFEEARSLRQLSCLGWRRIEEPLRRAIRIAAWLLTFFLLISLVRLCYLNFVKVQPREVEKSVLTLSQKQEVLRVVSSFEPQVFDQRELGDGQALLEPKSDTLSVGDHKKLLVRRGRVTPYVYHIPRGVQVPHWSRLFRFRPYERTILKVEDVGYFLFPGDLNSLSPGEEHIFVGRLNVNMRATFDGQMIVEGIAVMPFQRELSTVQKRDILLADDPVHRSFLERLRPSS